MWFKLPVLWRLSDLSAVNGNLCSHVIFCGSIIDCYYPNVHILKTSVHIFTEMWLYAGYSARLWHIVVKGNFFCSRKSCSQWKCDAVRAVVEVLVTGDALAEQLIPSQAFQCGCWGNWHSVEDSHRVFQRASCPSSYWIDGLLNWTASSRVTHTT